MKGASGQEPQEGGLLVVILCYLCRGHRGHLHPFVLASSHTQTAAAPQFSVCPWEKNGKREANSGECLPRPAPHPIHLRAAALSICWEDTIISSPSLSLSLPLRPSLHPLGRIGPVSVQRRYNPLTPLNDPEVECSSRMPMGPAGLTPAGAG